MDAVNAQDWSAAGIVWHKYHCISWDEETQSGNIRGTIRYAPLPAWVDVRTTYTFGGDEEP